MDAKGKQASSGVEFAVISPPVFLGLDSKPRIPVGENLCILAWIDRDRTDIQYFCRRRLGKRRHREKNKRDHKIDFSHSVAVIILIDFILAPRLCKFPNRYA